MANGGSDGSIIIDTELDNSGFQKGSKKMEGSIRNLVSSVDKIGKTTADSVYKAVPAINDMARSVQNAGNSAKQTATQIEGSFGKAISKSAASIKKLEGSLAKAKAGLSEYDREAASIQQSTDEMLKNANTPEQVNNVLAIEKAQMEALNAKYAAQLAAVQQITAELEAQKGVHANLEAQQQAAAQSAAAASAATGGGSTPPPNTVSGWQRFGQVLKQVGSSVSVEGFDSYSAEMGDHMIDLGRQLERLIEIIQNKRLIVDADSLEHGITSAQKSRQLSFSGV